MADEVDLRTSDVWAGMSDIVQRLRVLGRRDASLAVLDEHLENATTHALSAAMRLWAAEDLMSLGRLGEAAHRLERLAQEQGDETLFAMPWAVPALSQAAHAWAAQGELSPALRCWERLLQEFSEHRPPAQTLLAMASSCEHEGKLDDAASFYRKAIDAGVPDGGPALDAWIEARRGLDQLGSHRQSVRPSAERVARELADAFRAGSAARVDELLSATHARIGALGSEPVYAERSALLKLLDSALEGAAAANPAALAGTGDRRALVVRGLSDPLLRDVRLIIERRAHGFEWTGIDLPLADLRNPEHVARINNAAAARQDGGGRLKVRNGGPVERPPSPMPPAQPDRFYQSVADLGLRCPYPAGVSCRAGFEQFVGEALLVTLPWLGLGPAGVAAAALLHTFSNPCGFGFGGLYYGSGFTHWADEWYAVDFARFSPVVPFLNVTFNTPVLAVQQGIVRSTINSAPNGGFNAAGQGNEVQLAHIPSTSIPSNIGPMSGVGFDARWRYTSTYLHLTGPNLLPVSAGMRVRRGAVLGFMDSTGRSLGDHLHFSLHDSLTPYVGSDPPFYDQPASPTLGIGASVAPTPMDGQSLGARDGGRCMTSSNS